jgi:hypothetical protein
MTVCPNCGLTFEEGTAERPAAAFDEALQCPNCRAKVSDVSDECPVCGQALCPECGAAVDDEALVCPMCGAEFDLVCPECGAELGVEDTACSQCGVLFVGSEP